MVISSLLHFHLCFYTVPLFALIIHGFVVVLVRLLQYNLNLVLLLYTVSKVWTMIYEFTTASLSQIQLPGFNNQD